MDVIADRRRRVAVIRDCGGDCLVSGSMTVKGSKSSYTTTYSMQCVKIGGRWKVVDDPRFVPWHIEAYYSGI